MDGYKLRSIGLGMSYHGAGNIGDDLSLAGFLAALTILGVPDTVSLAGLAYRDLQSQVQRFPRIAWREVPRSTPDEMRLRPNELDAWVCAGSTLFQLTCGAYQLEYLLQALPVIKQFRATCLVCVGAEAEIAPRRAEWAAVARAFKRISVRDAASRRVLIDMLGIPPEQVFEASDLAHISLASTAASATAPSYEVGVIIAGDTLSREELLAVKKFTERRSDKVAFLANDVRDIPLHECCIYRELAGHRWSRMRRRSVLLTPPYADGDLAALVQPIASCRTVISSRYHGLLAAAWLGRRVAAINRSSKVSVLSSDMGLPACDRPLTVEKLEKLCETAVIVSRERLLLERERALLGVRFALEQK